MFDCYVKDYINDPDRPTLGLSFKDVHGDLITDHRSYKIKLMPFFSNLLPEGHLRKYLAEKADIHPEREFFLIWVLGRDLPGAVTIEPADGEADDRKTAIMLQPFLDVMPTKQR